MWQEVKEKEAWNERLKEIAEFSFLTEWWWGVFQERCGRRAHRIAFAAHGRTRAAAQIFFHTYAGSRGYGYCPRAPAYAADASPQERGDIERALHEWCRIAHAGERWIFYRMEPLAAPQFKNPDAVATLPRQPAVTCVLPLDASDEQLLRAMHEKTRYNIRLSQRKELQFEMYSAQDDTRAALNAFWRLIKDTNARDHIRSYEKGYYEKLFAAARIEQMRDAYLMLVRSGEGVLAGGIFIGSSDTFTYLFGASSSAERNRMAPYFLQWQAILCAQKLGYAKYDWWGINPERPDDPRYKKSWEGITRFKQGFGGTRSAYPSAFDVPIDRFVYSMYRLMRKIV